MREDLKEELKESPAGKYVRKNVDFDPTNGWQRKWTYKVGWIGSGRNIHLVAMTDGMITKEFSKGSFSKWMEDNDMVFMTKGEMMQFILDENDPLFRFITSLE